MRAVEEIKADIDLLEGSPSYYGNEWKKPKRDQLQAELFRVLTASIPLNRLSALCAAEREGRAVVLPCKVGVPVYYLELNTDTIHELRAQSVLIGYNNFISVRLGDWVGVQPEHFGKTVFLSREAAEAAKGVR
jgi:hypothetical protein